MHRAPAVSFSVKRSRWQARFILGTSLLALVLLGVFLRVQSAFDVRALVMTFVIVFSSSTALMGWRQSQQGQLGWDGQLWQWSGLAVGAPCRVRLVMDFQQVVIVCIYADGQPALHLWLEARSGDSTWRALRRALVSSQSVAGQKPIAGRALRGGVA